MICLLIHRSLDKTAKSYKIWKFYVDSRCTVACLPLFQVCNRFIGICLLLGVVVPLYHECNMHNTVKVTS
jgi:hypothetical protein